MGVGIWEELEKGKLVQKILYNFFSKKKSLVIDR